MEINNTPSNTAGKIKWTTVIVVAALVAGFGGWYLAGNKTLGKVLGADTNYQAVFLTNGQVYFGKLSDEGQWMQLTDIYYLQATQNLQQASDSVTQVPTSTGTAQTSQSNIQLVKLGSELHGPQDAMFIDRDKILFWENMKDDSKVVQAISQYRNK